jgi:anti-sigma B factor antagonist
MLIRWKTPREWRRTAQVSGCETAKISRHERIKTLASGGGSQYALPLQVTLMELKVSKRSTDGIPVVDLSGRLVFGDETKTLRSTVKEIIEHGDANIVLNLTDLAYVDSGGIGTLVGLYTSARAAGGDLKLACPNSRVQHVLEITRLMSILSVHESEEQAIADLRKKTAAAK